MRYDVFYAFRVFTATLIFLYLSFFGYVPFGIALVYSIFAFLSLLLIFWLPTIERSRLISFREYVSGFMVMTVSFYVTFIPAFMYTNRAYFSTLSVDLLYLYSVSVLETSLFSVISVNLALHILKDRIEKNPYIIPIVGLVTSIGVYPFHVHAWGGKLNALMAWLGYSGLNMGYIVNEAYYDIPSESIACDLHFLHNLIMYMILG